MNYYAFQVKALAEKKFIKQFKALHPDVTLPIYFPQRQLDIRKNGKIRQSLRPIFPGYLFVEAEGSEEIRSFQWKFRRTAGFFRFLASNQEITPLSNRDLELILHFIKNAGAIAGKSRVYLNEKSHIVVIDGPMSGLEGRIIKIDKRKGRAKIKLDLYEDSFAIDFAFEVIGAAS